MAASLLIWLGKKLWQDFRFAHRDEVIQTPNVTHISISYLYCQGNKFLRELNLGATHITDVTCSALAAVLPTNAALRRLTLSGNWISPEGINALAQVCFHILFF